MYFCVECILAGSLNICTIFNVSVYALSLLGSLPEDLLCDCLLLGMILQFTKWKAKVWSAPNDGRKAAFPAIGMKGDNWPCQLFQEEAIIIRCTCWLSKKNNSSGRNALPLRFWAPSVTVLCEWKTHSPQPNRSLRTSLGWLTFEENLSAMACSCCSCICIRAA